MERIQHLAPAEHRAFYSAQRFTLNLTRREMVKAGWSPSIRLFEAAACGVPIISDAWEGLDHFFEPGREILHPVAVTIFGGLISATLIDTFLTPVLFLTFGRKPLERIQASREGRAGSLTPAEAF
mgnify:CR=1 FL=1